MKERWEKYRLLDICDVYQPATISKKALVPNGKYDVYGANGVIGKYDKFNHEESEVLLGCRGACGCINVSSPRSWVNGNAMVVHPRTSELSKAYLVYILKTLDYTNIITGTAQPQITRTSLSNVEVPVPPLSEQDKIVSFLDAEFAKIDALKANTVQQFQAAKDLFQSALKEMLTPKEGWEEKKLCELCSITGEYGLNDASTTFNGIRYLRITDITDNGDLNDDKVSAIHHSDKKQSKLIEGDILFARTGATVGKTLVYREDFGDCEFAGYLIRYRTNPNVILPKYLFYITHSNNYYKWVAENQAAAAQPNISAQKYNNLIISFPSLPEQERIAARLDAISEKVKALQANYDQTITLCNDLKQSLLKSIFE